MSPSILAVLFWSLLRPQGVLKVTVRGPPPPPHLDSLVENGEVELPAQAADDAVIGHPHGEVIVVILGEGDGVGTLAAVVLLQEEFEGDVELALAVLHEGQILQVRLQESV